MGSSHWSQCLLQSVLVCCGHWRVLSPASVDCEVCRERSALLFCSRGSRDGARDGVRKKRWGRECGEVNGLHIRRYVNSSLWNEMPGCNMQQRVTHIILCSISELSATRTYTAIHLAHVRLCSKYLTRFLRYWPEFISTSKYWHGLRL